MAKASHSTRSPSQQAYILQGREEKNNKRRQARIKKRLARAAKRRATPEYAERRRIRRQNHGAWPRNDQYKKEWVVLKNDPLKDNS